MTTDQTTAINAAVATLTAQFDAANAALDSANAQVQALNTQIAGSNANDLQIQLTNALEDKAAVQAKLDAVLAKIATLGNDIDKAEADKAAP